MSNSASAASVANAVQPSVMNRCNRWRRCEHISGCLVMVMVMVMLMVMVMVMVLLTVLVLCLQEKDAIAPYLNIAEIIRVAKEAGCDAAHPG